MSVQHLLLVCTAGGRGDTATLRSAKSEESLSSLHNVEGNYHVQLFLSTCCLFFGVCKFDKAVQTFLYLWATLDCNLCKTGRSRLMQCFGNM